MTIHESLGQLGHSADLGQAWLILTRLTHVLEFGLQAGWGLAHSNVMYLAGITRVTGLQSLILQQGSLGFLLFREGF